MSYTSKYKLRIPVAKRREIFKNVMTIAAVINKVNADQIAIQDSLDISKFGTELDIPVDVIDKVETVYDFLEYSFDNVYIDSSLQKLIKNEEKKSKRRKKTK